MKVRIVQGVVAATVLSFGALAYGQTSNAIPSEETFEGMSEGASILVPNNVNGWYGDTNTTVAVATNVNYTWAGGMVLYPVTNAAHTKVLKFSEGSLTNQFATYDTSATATNMTVDFMIQPARSEEAPSTNLVAGSQTALYLDTNGLLNVWYGITADGLNNAWMTFTNTPSLGTSDWARVTVAFDYITDLTDYRQYFMVTVNGLSLMPTNNLGWTKGNAEFTQGPGGTWLITANPTKQIHGFALSGSGMLDDFVITTNAVTNFFPQPLGAYTLTGTVVGAHGTISPSSATVLPGGSTNFDVTAEKYYRIASLATNGAPVGAFDNNSTATNFTWSNVLADGVLTATFTAQLANNSAHTPYWWMAQYGLTNGGATFDQAAVADQDLDGLQAWQEYIVNTDPTNAASVLKVMSVTSDGVNDTVKWLSAAGSPNYSLFYSLNLTNALNGWTPSSNNIVPTPPTNSITITKPGQPAYYKVTVTN